MKKAVLCLMILSLVLTTGLLTSCKIFGEKTVDVAMVTDGGDVGKNSLDRAVWKAVKEFSDVNKKRFDVFYASEQTEEALRDCMMQAVSAGADVVVCTGKTFEQPLFVIQDLFPDVKFMIVDGEPHGVKESETTVAFRKADTENVTAENADGTCPSKEDRVKISKNVYCINFKSEQAGFLAGYAAVRNGCTKLGFISNREVAGKYDPYGEGFLEGIEKAAEAMYGYDEESNRINRVKLKYKETSENPAEDDSIFQLARDWYVNEGIEIIFASGDNDVPVIEAAEKYNSRVICSDSNHANMSNYVITSAVKIVDAPVKEALVSLYRNGGVWDSAHAGKSAVMGIEEHAVGLTDGDYEWRFDAFTIKDYEEVVKSVISGEMRIEGKDIFDKTRVVTEFKK